MMTPHDSSHDVEKLISANRHGAAFWLVNYNVSKKVIEGIEETQVSRYHCETNIEII